MTTENNTTYATAATISEKELWAAFLPLTITKSISTGPFEGFLVENYSPADNVIDCGSHGCTEDLSAHLADDVAESDNPDEALECWIDDLESYVAGLKIVQEHFRALKRMAIVTPPEPESDLLETDPAAYRAWETAAIKAEESPRYAPIVANNAEAA
jgi:hypothetical protein